MRTKVEIMDELQELKNTEGIISIIQLALMKSRIDAEVELKKENQDKEVNP